jgi:hypothetical protein
MSSLSEFLAYLDGWDRPTSQARREADPLLHNIDQVLQSFDSSAQDLDEADRNRNKFIQDTKQSLQASSLPIYGRYDLGYVAGRYLEEALLTFIQTVQCAVAPEQPGHLHDPFCHRSERRFHPDFHP